MIKAIVFALLVAFAVAAPVYSTPAGTNQRILIDNFIAGANIQGFIETFSPADVLPKTFTSFYPSASGESADGILGGERDLLLTCTAAEGSNSMTSKITALLSQQSYFWEVATPVTLSGYSRIQWDGNDDNPSVLSTGLGGIDLTDGGNNRFFYLRLTRDISAEFVITFKSTNNNECVYNIPTTGTDGNTDAILDVFIPFADITGSCSLSSIGGIQIQITQNPNTDATVFLVGIYGTQPSESSTPTPLPSASRTPTGTPTPTTVPSQSRTPTPAPSQSRTPTATGTGTRTPTPAPSQSRTPTATPTGTRTPTPTPSPECVCICPAFTCALIFDADDDVNNVYYFTGEGFTFPDTVPDDDDDNLTVSNPFTGGNSGASVLTVSIAIIAVIVAMI